MFRLLLYHQVHLLISLVLHQERTILTRLQRTNTTIMPVVTSQHRNRNGLLLRLHILEVGITPTLHQEMLHTKINVILGSETEEELPGNPREGTEDHEDGHVVGPVIATEKGIDEIEIVVLTKKGIVVLTKKGIVVLTKKGNVVSIKIVNVIVDAMIEETEIGTGKETGKESGQRVDRQEEIADHPVVVTVINTKRVNEKSGRGARARNPIKVSRKR